MRKGKAKFEFRGSEAVVSIDLDGSGDTEQRTGSAFLDHMLQAFSKTGGLNLRAKANGAAYFRAVALGKALGEAVNDALGDRNGIRRYGWAAVPMDEALGEVALDFSGRPYLVMRGQFKGDRIGDLETQNVKAFLEAMTTGARITLNVRFEGVNDHHKAESIFKALGLALREGSSRQGTGIPSTKGVI